MGTLIRSLIVAVLVCVLFVGMVCAIGILGEHATWWAFLGCFAAVIGFVICLIAIVAVVNSIRPRKRHMTIEEMEQNGLLVSEDYKARRAFQVEEFEDEGLHYMLELEDNSVLKLTGQVYYDLDPIYGDPEYQPRTFPCTEFTLRRNKANGDVIDVICGGTVLEPEAMAPAFDETDDEDFIWKPFAIITDKTYDELKRERMNRNT